MNQFGFMTGRSIIETIFLVKIKTIIERYKEEEDL
jgi:hypothetical protein